MMEQHLVVVLATSFGVKNKNLVEVEASLYQVVKLDWTGNRSMGIA